MRMCSWLAVLVLMLLLPLSSTNLYADGIRHSQGIEDVVRCYIVRIEAIRTWVSKCVDPTQLNLSRVLSGVKRGMWSCAYLELFNAMKGDPRVAWLVTPDVFLGMKVFALNGSGELELVDVVMIASYASLSPAVKEELLILLEALRQGDSSAVELAARLVLQEVSSPDANPVDRLLAALALQAVSEMGYEGVSLPEVSLRDFEALASLLTQLAHYTNSSAYRASIANASELFRRLALEGPSKELVSLADEVVAEYKLYPFRAPLLPFLMISALFPSVGSTSKRQLQVEQTIEILALVYKVLAEGRLRNVGIEEAIDIALEAVGSQDLKLDRRLVREVL
ncbi:MAG: hypothetical protein DRO39_06900, partial [Thermoprotei archaeon]